MLKISSGHVSLTHYLQLVAKSVCVHVCLRVCVCVGGGAQIFFNLINKN